MKEPNEDYGFATIGVGTANEKVRIENWISAHYKDGRKITITRLEGNDIGITVENHESSNRSTRQEMLLTQESYMAIYATISLHLMGEGGDPEKKIADSINGEDIHYSCTPNLKITQQ